LRCRGATRTLVPLEINSAKSMPESIPDILVSLRDLAQVLFIDRLNPRRIQASKAACAACRKLRFHSRSRIRPLSWPDLFQKLGIHHVDLVSLPSPLTDFGGATSKDEYYALAALARGLQPGIIFEFGTYLGVGTLTMAANTPPACKIYTLDLSDAVEPDLIRKLGADDKTFIGGSRHRVGQAFLQSPFADRIVQIRDDSMTFRAESRVTNVDLAFVDGGHSLPVVAKDSENALRILSSTGTIIWDDYGPWHPGVVTYLEEFSASREVYSITGTNFVIHSRRWPSGMERK